DFDGAGKHLAGEIIAAAAKLIEELAAAEVVVVSLDVGRGRLGDGFFFAFGEHDLQGGGNTLGDLVLDGEQIFDLAVGTLSPGRMTGAGLHELRSNAQAVSAAPQAAAQDVGSADLLADLGRGDRLVTVSEHFGAWKNSEPGDLG